MPAVGNVISVLPADKNDETVGGQPPPRSSSSGNDPVNSDSNNHLNPFNSNLRSKDVDHLVQEIKENLKLSSHHHHHGGLKMRGPLKPHHKKRSTPYHVPPSSRVACDTSSSTSANGGGGVSQLRRWNHRRRYPSTCMANTDSNSDQLEDPFQMLQELITDGGLIKEAVRRLQLGLTPKYALSASSPNNNNNNGNQKQKGFYDSDEECRTPPAEYSESLCCGGI